MARNTISGPVRMVSPDVLVARARGRIRQSVWECLGFMSEEEIFELVRAVVREREEDRP